MSANQNNHMAISDKTDNSELQTESSLSTKLTVYALSFLLATQPLLVSAQTIVANSTQTQQINALNGVPIINIATPSAKGVSHNQFQQFNVDAKGLILNNAKTVVSTQLAGFIDINPNLQAGNAASLIINEVVGPNRSQLHGYTEVAGQQANVVIANPYGITCNGCGFINTPRASLTTGIPQISNGGLTGFNVTGGDVSIEGLGLNAENISQFDIISRAVTVNADIHAQNLNIVTGSNDVNYDSLNATATSTSDTVEFALDSSAVGGMYANAIRLVGTEAGVGVRTLGNVATNIGDLTLSADGKISIANTQSAGNLTLTSTTDGIELNQAVFSSGTMDIHAKTSVNNHNSLSAGQAVNVSADSLNNSDVSSEIISGKTLDITVNTLANTQATISAEGTLTLTANSVSNASGAVIQGQNIALTVNGDVTNQASEINSLGAMSITADTIDNSTGAIVSQTSLVINTDQNVNNTQGGIHANQDLTISANTVENASGKIETHGSNSVLDLNSRQINNQSGRIVNEGNGLTTISSINGITNSNTDNLSGGGQIGGQGDLVVSATDVSNTEGAKIIAGDDMTLNVTNQLTNTGGELVAGQTLTWQQTADFDNDNGELTADTVTVNVSNTSNQSGTISSKTDLWLQTALTGSGNLLAGRDGTIVLTQDVINNGGQIKANHDLTITGQGTINSAADIEAINALFLTATSLTNQSAGVINAKTTSLTTSAEIKNSGHIEGNSLTLTSSDFNNTGNVLGDDLILTTNNLTNEGASAFIGATNQLDLYVANNLINRDGALIYSLSDLTIAADETFNKTVSILNSSANIEADGDLLSIYSDALTNQKTSFVTGYKELSRTPITKVYFSDADRIAAWNKYWPSVYGKYRIERVWKQGNIVVSETAITQDSERALIRAANEMDLHITNTLTNAYSDIIAGNALNFDVGTLTNIAATKETKTQEIGSYIARIYKTRSGTCNEAYSTDIYSWCNASATLNEESSTFSALNGGESLFSGNKTLTGSAWTINNINENETVINNGASLDSNQTVSIKPFIFTLPSSGLFTLRPEPTSNYLIETAPRFTNFAQFVSSDYMLSRLNLDPEQIPKRLGDGFYEQRLVLEQLIHQTGKHYLDDSANGKTHYTALMDAGIAAAEQLKLTPYVALTQQQIAALTKPIVWMETDTITLADGSTTSVLVPKVYLANAQNIALSRGGALMVADELQLSINDAIINSGSIVSKTNTVITANDINNLGGRLTSQGDIDLTAQHTITNTSGTIKGVQKTRRHQGSTVTAGGALTINATNDITVTGSALTANNDINLTAGQDIAITAAADSSDLRYIGKNTRIIQDTTHQASSLNSNQAIHLQAGQDIDIIGSDITAQEDISLHAQGDTTIAAAQDSYYFYSYEKIKKSFGRSKTTTIEQDRSRNIASKLTAGGNVMINSTQTDSGITAIAEAGNISLIGSDITAGQEIALTAGDTLVTAPGVDYDYEKIDITKKGLFGTGSQYTKTSQHQRQQQAQLNSEQNTRLTAEGDITLIAPKITSEGDVDITSEAGTVTLATAKDTDYQNEDYSKTGGFSWSYKNEGHQNDTVRHTDITAKGDIHIQAANGLVVEYKQNGNLNQSIDSLSQLPELAWMGDLKARDDINWQAVEEVHQHWLEQDSGMGGPGFTLIAIAVAIATAGAGAELLGMTQAATAGSLTAIEAAQVAVVDSLINQAAMSLIVNKGDIGAVFKDIVSKEGLMSLATAGATAGITNGLFDALDIPQGVSLADLDTSQLVKATLINAGTKATLDAAIYGESLGDSLVDNLQLAAVSAVGAKLAGEIGDAWHSSEQTGSDKALQLIAHAAVGCGLSAGSGGECAGGAAGAVTGELVGSLVETNITEKLSQGTITGADLQRWQEQGVNLAKLAGGVAALLTSGDSKTITAGAQSGANAAENNALFLIPLALVLMQTADVALTAKDAYDLAEAVQAGDDDKVKEISTSLAIGLATEEIPGNKIVQKIVAGVKKTFGKKADGVVEALGDGVSTSALKQFGRSVDELSSAASQPFKNTGLTNAARALDKHAAGQRSSGTFPPLSGNAAARNKQAQQIVDDILNNSKSEFKTLGRGGLEVRSPSGQGVRFNKDGSFSGFVD